MRFRILHARTATGVQGPLPLLPVADPPLESPAGDEGLERLLTPDELDLVRHHRV